MNRQVKLALEIAKEAHKGQFRHDNKTPYIEHPKEVAMRFYRPFPIDETEILYSVALLHDVIEDSKITAKELLKRGVRKIIVDKVVILTKIEGEKYIDYLLRVKEDSLATKVKIEDIKHNLSTLEPKKKAQRDKYLLALYILEN